MPFLLAEILNFQGSTHRIGVGSFRYLYKKNQLLLLRLVDVVTKYIDAKLEEQSKYLISEYNSEEIKPVLDVIRCEDIPMATTW